MRIKIRGKGFTVIEMVISTMILCVATLALAGLLITAFRGWSSGTDQEAIAGGTTIAMQKLGMDIRDGVSASTGTVNGVPTLTVTFPATMTDATTHETVYDYSGAGTTTRSYYILNGNLVRSAGGVVSTIGRGVTSATFGASGGSVTITLQTAQQVGTSVRSLQITGQVRLRNFHT